MLLLGSRSPRLCGSRSPVELRAGAAQITHSGLAEQQGLARERDSALGTAQRAREARARAAREAEDSQADLRIQQDAWNRERQGMLLDQASLVKRSQVQRAWIRRQTQRAQQRAGAGARPRLHAPV